MKGDVVIAHMNEIFGITGWSMHYKDSIVKVIQQPNTHAKGFFHVFAQTTCVVTLRDGTVRTGLGMNDNEQPAYASAMDTSQKAAETDALKRACKNFGNYLGLACVSWAVAGGAGGGGG
jgi:recombination DNA repair RAD52 pathway protein